MTKMGTVISRILAAGALAASVIILIVVVSSAGSDNSDGDKPPKKATATKNQPRKPKSKARKYTVQEGDSLSVISDRTGIPVDRIEQLNPDLDPQALTIGQTLKLR